MDRTCEERPAEDGSDEENPDSTETPVRIRDTPEDIVLEAPATGLAFHPARDLLAAGDVDGDVFVFSYSCQEGETKELWSSGHHLKSCRAVAFSEDGQKLVTVSKDKAIHVLDVEQGRLERRISKAHGALLRWGLWPSPLLCSLYSGDGCLGVFNIRRRRFELLSEPQSGDLTSVTLMKYGKKVACGSGEGTIYLFNWNGFGATSDRFALRAESIDCMVPVTESLLCAGSTDGVIRAVNILPNRVVGTVGQHAGEPVEKLALCHCGHLLASSGHDQRLKFWSMAQLRAVVVEDYRRRKKKGGPLRALSSKAWSTADFFAGLREEGEDCAAQGGEEREDDRD
ncbi:WD repeat-containing protein 55 isoform X2 [Mirounga angustirostris]|uniref:WD repeat-containing protein 55 isoform X2 n=1 Tax=Mirounga angustirostris TaxID=9716 RepID=UPI001E687FB3|nr:WD repeat-containing protein 55 isoform X2 [Mirounga angustirostris]